MSGNSQPCEAMVRSPMLPTKRTEQLINTYGHKKSLKPDDLPQETGRVRNVVAVLNSNDHDRGRSPTALGYTSSPYVCATPPYQDYYGSKSNSMVSVETQTENLRSMSIDQEVKHQRCCGCNLGELEEKIQEQGRQIKQALEQTVAPLIVEVGSIQQTSGFEWKKELMNMFEKQSEQLDKSNKSISEQLEVTAQLREEQNQILEKVEKSLSTNTQCIIRVVAELKNTVLMSERNTQQSHHAINGSAKPDCVHAAQQCADPKHQKGYSDKPAGSGSRWNSWFGSSNQDTLKEENERLRQQVNNCMAQLQRYESTNKGLKKKLEEAEKKSKCSKEALMKFKSQTEGEWTGSETPSSVSQKFGLLFSTVRNSSTDATLKASSGRELANDIFKVAYEECHIVVLKELFKELFCHHGPGDNKEIAKADSQKKVYGMLLGLRKEPPQVTLDHDFLTEQVLKKVLRPDVVQCVKSNTKYDFAKKAVETALDMVSMQPPMIIDYPEKLASDDIQEKQFSQWDDSLQEGEYELRYLRPVLYSSYRDQEYLQKAHVGNKRVN